MTYEQLSLFADADAIDPAGVDPGVKIVS